MCSCPEFAAEVKQTMAGWCSALCSTCKGKLPVDVLTIAQRVDAHLDGSKPLGFAEAFRLMRVMLQVQVSLR